MRTLETPKMKLVGAAVLLAAVPLVATFQRLGATNGARLALGVAAVAGLGWWWNKHRASQPLAFKLPPRLQVIQRVGLSQRAGLALVEVDGQSYLVVHGDGFAKLQRTRRLTPRVVAAQREGAL